MCCLSVRSSWQACVSINIIGSVMSDVFLCTQNIQVVCNSRRVFISRVSMFLSFEHIDETVCFVYVVMFHAHLFSVYVWSVVHMHRAGQAASQYCVVPAVGSIPHRVAYSSDLVPNSELVQYSSDVLSVLSTIPDCFDLVIRESLILCSCLVIHASLWNVSYCM